MQIIKCKYLKDGTPRGRDYTFFSNEVVAIGDMIQINEKTKGVVTAINVPESEIEAFRDKVKFIKGKVIEDKKPVSFEEMQETEKLCEYCDWTNGEIPHKCDSVCEGAWCDGAYKGYLAEFEEKENC